MTIRLLLVDDHKVMREGLRVLLEKKPEFEVVGEAGDGRTAIRMTGEVSPDVVIMDIGMRELNGIETTRRIVAQYPDVKVIALSTYSDKRYVLEMLESGAYGYVLKEEAGEELCRAVNAAARNRQYLSPDVAGTVVEGYVGRVYPSDHSAAFALTQREREVIQLLSEGYSSPEIARHLHIAPATVEVHRRNIMKKLDLHSVAELTKYAVREGLTSPE
jgi:two-component system NarL family response regulator